ncbi:hypothetical protein ACQ859_30135 [Roseateles chitinivorans]|uniref:hypothetical protein n=1 Tax=Roseateles chitinivorans TaxID=2917965 RepID=UPI003D664F99
MPLFGVVLAASFLAACGASDVGRNLPERWDLAFDQKSMGEIVEQLGAPQEEASAKQFLNWVEPTPTGKRLLKVICPIKCQASERPTMALFIVHRAEDDKQIHMKVLIDAKVREARTLDPSK